MRRLVASMLICLAAFSLLPVSYACVTGGTWSRCQPQPACRPRRCPVAFTWVEASDNEQENVEPKEVGDIQAQIVDRGKKIMVTVTNAYPHYIGYVRFKIKNVGDVPVKITGVTIDNPNADALEVCVSKSRLMWGVMEAGGSRCGLLTVGLKQEALMSTTYGFTVSILVKQCTCGGSCP